MARASSIDGRLSESQSHSGNKTLPRSSNFERALACHCECRLGASQPDLANF